MTHVTPSDISAKQNKLALQLNKDSFADLILNFLGKKSKLVYKDAIEFIVRLNDLEQFYYLLEQKLEKESNIYIEHFQININYNDGTGREMSGIEALNHYHETRDVIPVSVTLTWNIVIDFPYASTLENQTIELSFTVEDKKEDQTTGQVVLTINHTNKHGV